MAIKFDSDYPSIDDLRTKAQKKISKFAFEYLDGGCSEDLNIDKKTSEIRDVIIKSYYLSKHTKSELQQVMVQVCCENTSI